MDELLDRDKNREKDGFPRKIRVGKLIKPGKGGKDKIVVVPIYASYFDDYDWYRVDEIAKRIFNKAHVSVHLGPKESVGMNFNSNQEALDWAEEIIIKSGKKLEAVIYE